MSCGLRAARALTGGLALVLVLGTAACEPSGPGDLAATVQAPVPTGALVIEMVGRGITGFGGLGDARTFASSPLRGAAGHRVILVSPSGAALRFRVQVEDVSENPPTATVVSAVDTSNRPIAALTGYTVRIAR